MNPIDYESLRARLLESGEFDIAKAPRIFDTIFRRQKVRPRDAFSSLDAQLLERVCESLPTPFAEQVKRWADAYLEFPDIYSQWENAANEPAARKAAAKRVSDAFTLMFNDIWKCWLQIVRFLPFVLIAMLQRFDDDTVRRHTAAELARAFYHYKTFYEKIDDDRRRESDQLHLLIFLMRVFRRLSYQGVLDQRFFFAPLLRDTKEGFDALFPVRFDLCMRAVQAIRNRFFHDSLPDRSPDLVEPIFRLTYACFCDVIGTLLPVCEHYSLNYVTALKVDDDQVLATALDFSGLSGPSQAVYDVTPGYQIAADFQFRQSQLYLIARPQSSAGADGQPSKLLTSDDYLDLTPFLISHRLLKRPDDQEQFLFVLQRYLASASELLFLELAGATQQTLSGESVKLDSGNQGSLNLVERIEDFKARTRALTAQFALDLAPVQSVAAMPAVLWSVSRQYLDSMLDTSRYDEAGRCRTSAANLHATASYDPDLFVAPAISERVTDFFQSDRRMLVIVGDSGYGKSNLLVHHFLERIGQGKLGVIFSGQQFDTPLLDEFLTTRLVVKALRHGSTLEDLHELLDENAEELVIVIDAVNEYSGRCGPLSLLNDIFDTLAVGGSLRRCKLAVSCRSEMWKRYVAGIGHTRRLAPEVFFLDNGGPLWVKGFESENSRRALYERYQQRYHLEPVKFEDLSETLRELIAQPIMIALVAEAYANKTPGGENAGTIPADLNFYDLFQALTNRKKDNALVLVPLNETLQREVVGDRLDELCEMLAALIYERLMRIDDNGQELAGRDAVPVDEIDKNVEFQPYVRPGSGVCFVDLALEVGLFERVRIQRRDRSNSLVFGTAFHFFHDQYTQFWIAAVYDNRVLGNLNAQTLGNPTRLEALIATIASIMEKAIDAPVLGGAFDHWLQRNVKNLHGGNLAPAVPLFNAMASHESPLVQSQLVTMLTMLILRRALSAHAVYEPIFQDGSAQLRLRVVQSFGEYWPELSASAARALIDACDPVRDREVLERLADVFTIHLLEKPLEVVAYLDKVVDKPTLGSVTELSHLRRQAQFMLQFTVFSLMASFDQADRVEALRKLFRAKYAPLTDLLIGTRGSSYFSDIARKAARQFIYAWAENFGVSQWNHFIGNMEESGNEDFYVEVNGVVQQDVLREFLPYAIDVHNGQFERLSLETGSHFHTLMLRMLDFKVMSIIGYNAVLALPSVLLRHEWQVTEDFTMTLIERRTPAVLFFGNLLLLNLSYSDPGMAQACLSLMHRRVVPMLLADNLACDWSIIFCIASLDVDALWPAFESILQQLLAHIEKRNDARACDAFGDVLYKACFCPEIGLGHRLIEYQLADQARFLGPLWRNATLKVMAAMLARNPAELRTVCAAHGVGDNVIRAARGAQSEELIKQSRLFPMQVDVNRFTAWVYVGCPQMRLAVIKYFIGSLATGHSLEDFATGVRQTVVALIKVFFGSDAKHTGEASAERLSLDEIVATTSSSRGWRRRRQRSAASEAGTVSGSSDQPG